jgi:hypothetical protein
MSRFLADQPMNNPMAGAGYGKSILSDKRIGEYYGKTTRDEEACDAPYPPPGYLRAMARERLEEIHSIMRITEDMRQRCSHLGLPLPEDKLDDVVKDLMVAWSEQRLALRKIDLDE